MPVHDIVKIENHTVEGGSGVKKDIQITCGYKSKGKSQTKLCAYQMIQLY
jgi:hypothetical protein